jgi:type IV pilus assembly protein PilB
MARKTLLDILVSEDIVSGVDAERISGEARGSNERMEELLLAAHVPEDDVLRAKSLLFGVPSFRVSNNRVAFAVLKYISEDTARQYHIVPLELQEGVLAVGMVYPDDINAREALNFISANSNIPFKVYAITQQDYNRLLEQYKGLGGEVNQALGEFEQEMQEKYPSELTLPQDQSEIVKSDTPITKLVAVILKHATEGNASDIHIEPTRDRLRVRFRMDGTLYTSLFLPIGVHEAIVARVKILTRLKLDEKRKPQDGRFSTMAGGLNIDFRVSTFPTYFGEKVVIRILDPATGVKQLDGLGIKGRGLKLIQDIIQRPYGLVLVTGPTGSGKTTTLYAMLQLLNKERSNIVSLEDPIEYNIAGINQSQVRPEIQYTFATGLRSVLRQDPDIIMVGEIRDKETAQLAIHAALTGHLVLSTLHTNTAIGAIPRLIDMGVDPFLIPATLALVVGQRLVRTLCEESKKPIAVEDKVREALEKEIATMPELAREHLTLPDNIYQALPSAECPKGTRGRMGVFEVLTMTTELEKLILEDQPSEMKISKEAYRQGMLTMRQDGILKVFEGTVGIEELMQVVV